MKYTQKELAFIIERIDKSQYELNEWEQSFFNSIRNQTVLTGKQQEIVSKIWDKLEDL